MSYAELQAKMEEIQTKLFDPNIEGKISFYPFKIQEISFVNSFRKRV